MKMKLIISLLALCLTLSVVSAQTQTDKDMAGSMKDMNAVLTGDIAKTITCNVTGNAFVVGTGNISEKMENMTGAMGETRTENQTQSMAQTQTQNMTEGQTQNMTEGQTQNMTEGRNQSMTEGQSQNMTEGQNQNMTEGQSQNMTEGQTGTMAANQTGTMTKPVTCNVVGKIVIVKDMGNMTEKALMIGKMDKMPGKVVMFGKMSKMGGTAERVDTSGYMKNVTIVTVGAMTGTMTCNMTRNMETMTGEAGSTENMTGRMENMAVLAAGNMTGNITCDLSRKMIIVRNIGSMDEIAEKMCNMSGRTENVSGRIENMSTENMSRMENMSESMCNMTGSMIILKDMDNMVGTAEKMDIKTEMTKMMDYMSLMDASTVIITDRATDSRMEDKNITRAFENRNNIIGEMAIIRNMDDATQIMTKTFTCNMTGNTTTVQAGSIAGRIGSM